MSFINHCYLIMSRAFKKNPLMYFLIIVSQIVSVMCIFFAFGLIVNAYTSFKNADINERFFSLELTDIYNEDLTSFEEQMEGAVSYGEFFQNFKEIREMLGDNLQEVLVKGYIEIDEKQYRIGSYYHDADSGYKKYDISVNPKFFPQYDVSDSFTINGRVYNVATLGNANAISFLNYEDVPDDAIVYEFYFVTKEPLIYDQYKKLENKICILFNYNFFEKPQTPKLLDIQMNKTQITLSAVLIVIVVLNCSLCYMFLYESRKKTFAIYRICGAREGYCIFICLAEVIVYMIISFATAFLLFDKLVKNIVVDIYPKAVLAYTSENYRHIFGGYFVATMIIMTLCIISFVSKPIVEERK